MSYKLLIESKINQDKVINYLELLFDSNKRLDISSELDAFISSVNSNCRKGILYDSPAANCFTIVIIDETEGLSFLYFVSKYFRLYHSIIAVHNEENTEKKIDDPVLFDQEQHAIFFDNVLGYTHVSRSDLHWRLNEAKVDIRKKLQTITYFFAVFNDDRVEIKSIAK